MTELLHIVACKRRHILWESSKADDVNGSGFDLKKLIVTIIRGCGGYDYFYVVIYVV
ncbi:uncharacterized protein TrAFT101_007817 [Trichoderma asperellum]|uniref:uncharacterized protein n=1 Tax=Trichoderma asperellum TaxID=101201 RepID=UPI00331D9A12|nr:hypothetical protein TrAFT101_007817 [Trichoderma asperellum]